MAQKQPSKVVSRLKTEDQPTNQANTSKPHLCLTHLGWSTGSKDNSSDYYVCSAWHHPAIILIWNHHKYSIKYQIPKVLTLRWYLICIKYLIVSSPIILLQVQWNCCICTSWVWPWRGKRHLYLRDGGWAQELWWAEAKMKPVKISIVSKFVAKVETRYV